MAEDVHYCSRPEDFHLFPNTAKAIKLLNDNGFKVILITNQSGIGRRLFNSQDLCLVHREMVKQLALEDAKVTDIYYCPHHPDTNCHCRKPKPQLLYKAAKDHDIDITKSYVTGDSWMDKGMAEAAGCPYIEVTKDFDLLDAVGTIIQQSSYI